MKKMKHAYLIMAHGKWELLNILLKQLDSPDNDFYIHIDKKVKDVPFDIITNGVKCSEVKFFQEYKIYWGSYEMILTELFLLKESLKGNYDYYHLLSGMDLAIKSKEYIYSFFEKNNGCEFIHFASDDRIKNDHEIMRRVKLYHFFANYRKGFKSKLLNNIFTFIAHVILMVQLFLGIDRTKKFNDITFKYGSQWFSITESCARYVVSQENLIKRIFYKTKCSDEMFLQTIVYNSKYKDKLYNQKFDNDCIANVRLIDIEERGKDGSPYVWKLSDYKELKNSKCLFARKFDLVVDDKIVKKIVDK